MFYTDGIICLVGKFRKFGEIMNIIDNYNYINTIASQLFTPQRNETSFTSTTHDTVSISNEAKVLFANSQNIQQGNTTEQDSEQQSNNESYASAQFKKTMQWNSVKSNDDELTEEEKQRKIQEEIHKKQAESLNSFESTNTERQASIFPDSLDNFAPTGQEANAQSFFVPSIVQDNMPHISELPAVGEAGGGMKIQQLFDKGNNAWNAYTQAMNEFGLEDSISFAQSDDFAQWRSANPELAQELDARSKAIFNQMT